MFDRTHSYHNHCVVWFRFGSVHYTAMVYVNGQHLITHAGGHLPFEAEVGIKSSINLNDFSFSSRAK